MKVWQINEEQIDMTAIEEAAKYLRSGELVAFPTETVYGLGGNGLDSSALNKIFAAKGRPGDNPLILHIQAQGELADLAQEISPTAQLLMDTFWPGPLTLVLKKTDRVPLEATGGLDTVAVRMPDNEIALALIRAAGVPIAAPSANLSGKPSPTSARDVIEDMDGKIAGVIDGGEAMIGLESTVVDCTGSLPMILRPGGITLEMLEEAVGVVEVDPGLTSESETPKAPGMKYAHYAPQAKMVILEDEQDLAEALSYGVAQKKKICFIIPDDIQIREKFPESITFVRLGNKENWAPLGADFYKVLRESDRQQVEEIYVMAVPEEDLGVAIMNRMRKAAGHRYWKNR